MLEVGKLYTCKQYFLMLYPDQETAVDGGAAWAAAARRTADAAAMTAYWSKQLGKPVTYCDPETPLLVLNTNNEYVEVLAGDKRVWIVNVDWLEIEEIV